nr:glutathione S-transferase T3-like [Lolium perenne]
MDKSQLSNSQMDLSNEINSQMDNSSFLDMLNVGGDTHWGGTPDSSPIGEQARMPTQNIRTSAKPKSRKGTSTKGKNWSSVEDKVLIQAWANTSLDAVTGTDQNSQSYWGRISEYYKAHKQPSWPERNANALNCRFGGISASTSKFCGYLQQIINKDESGRTIDDKKIDAEEMYISLDPNNKPFTLMHCYIEFEKHPKWQTQQGSKKKQKKTSDASPGTTSTDEDFGVCTDALEKEKRPPGTKYEKERRGKAHVSDGT